MKSVFTELYVALVQQSYTYNLTGKDKKGREILCLFYYSFTA